MKKTLKIVLAFVVAFLAWYHQEVVYGLQQGYGQLEVIFSAKPIQVYLSDNQYPDSLKYKIRLIQEIKKFAEDSLGIHPSDCYQTLYDQQGKPLIWVVTACQPFEMKAKYWTFPLVGGFSYKGFFVEERAIKESERLQAIGYDTDIRTVSAWSTLGILNDPILSQMLDWSEGMLASTIIHELTHGTIFVKSDITYNENLASFVGDEGAKLFLAYRFGSESLELKKYLQRKEDRELFSQYALRGALYLDTLYQSFNTSTPLSEKVQKKEAAFKHIIQSLDTLKFNNPLYYTYFDDFVPNNAFFMGFRRYREKQKEFRDEMNLKFEGDLKKYIAYHKKINPSFF
jgi:predicted aminopeptidase